MYLWNENLQLKHKTHTLNQRDDGRKKWTNFFRHLVAYFVHVCLSLCAKCSNDNTANRKYMLSSRVQSHRSLNKKSVCVCFKCAAAHIDIDKNERLKNAFKWSMKKLAYLIKLKKMAKRYMACASIKRMREKMCIARATDMKRILNKENRMNGVLGEWKIIEW